MSASPSMQTHAGPSASDLFTSEEARFMRDSLTSADSFDPFTVGAPGFKVPAILPPHLGGIGAAPGSSSLQDHRRSSSTNGAEAAAAAASRMASSSYHGLRSVSQDLYARNISDTPAMSMQGISAGALLGQGNSWEHQLRRPSLFDPDWLSASQSPASRAVVASVEPELSLAVGSNPSALLTSFAPNAMGGSLDSFNLRGIAEEVRRRKAGMTAEGHTESVRAVPALWSGLPESSNGGVAQAGSSASRPEEAQGSMARSTQASATSASGYGRDRQWQLEQLEFLQAERERYRAQSTVMTSGGTGYGLDFLEAPDGSSYPRDILNASGVPRSRGRSGPSGNVEGRDFWQSTYESTSGPDPKTGSRPRRTTSQGFASFPAHRKRPDEHEEHVDSTGSRPTNLSALGLTFPSSHNFPAASDKQRQRVSTSSSPLPSNIEQDDQPGVVNTLSKNSSRGAASNAHKADPKRRRTEAGPSDEWASSAQNSGELRQASERPRGRSPSARPSWTSPPPKVNGALPERAHAITSADGFDAKGKGRARQPPANMPDSAALVALFPSDTDTLQPHLDLLKTRQTSVSNGMGVRGSSSPDKESKEKKAKQPHVLLTEAEKKANHIASEQKRRANIRRGYEMLCEIVPPLREALEREAARERGENAGDEDGEEEEDGEDAKTKKGRKRKGKRKDPDGGAGCEIGGEKIDGRAGPRSEAIVLMKSVEYLRDQLEVHRELLARRVEARSAAAAVATSRGSGELYGSSASTVPVSSEDAMQH